MYQSNWWAIVVRILSAIENEGPCSTEEYSLRIIQATTLEQAKTKAVRYVRTSNPDRVTTDGKTIRSNVVSVIGAEHLGESPPTDGDEIWSRLAFQDREEDQAFEGESPPFWALRAFHTDWSVKNYEERR